jgi:hypothetical protein
LTKLLKVERDPYLFQKRIISQLTREQFSD